MANYGCIIRQAGTLPSAKTGTGSHNYTLNRYTSVHSMFNNQSRSTSYCGSSSSAGCEYMRYEVAGPSTVLSTVTGIAFSQGGIGDGYISYGLQTYMGTSKWDQGAYEGRVNIPISKFTVPSGVTAWDNYGSRVDYVSGSVYFVRVASFTHEGQSRTFGFLLYNLSTFDPEHTYTPDYIYDLGVPVNIGLPQFMATFSVDRAVFIYKYSTYGTVIAYYNGPGSVTRKYIRFPVTGPGVYYQQCQLFNWDGTYLYFQHYQGSSPAHWYFVRVPVSSIPFSPPSSTNVDIDDCDIAVYPEPPAVTTTNIATVMMPYNGGLYVGKASDNNITASSTIPIVYLSFATMPPAPPEPSDDPYQEEGGISDYGGGGGGVDMDTSDNVDFPTLPQNLIADCGLVSFYNPSKSEIMQLADQILSQSIGGAIKNFFTDPLDGIVSLSLANVTPPLSGTRGEIKVGLIGTGVTANLLSSSYMNLDCGTIQVGDKTKGNALDFTPYTKAELYLPFIGTVSVSPDDFMYSSVNIKYNIDLMSGTCVANVRIAKDGKNDILYSLDGNVLSQVPLSGKSYAELIKALASIGTALALGGSAGAAVAGVAGATLTNSKPAIARSGRMSLATGALSPKKPYLIFSRPKQSLPEKFKSYKGYPSNVTTKLSEIIGFTQVKEIHIEGIPATSEELTMIEDQLKEGVII